MALWMHILRENPVKQWTPRTLVKIGIFVSKFQSRYSLFFCENSVTTWKCVSRCDESTENNFLNLQLPSTLLNFIVSAHCLPVQPSTLTVLVHSLRSHSVIFSHSRQLFQWKKSKNWLFTTCLALSFCICLFRLLSCCQPLTSCSWPLPLVNFLAP